jgi:DNA-binding LytR/AlgR family response regulator
MMINCIAIDDEQFALDTLAKHCEAVSYLNLAATFCDPIEAQNYLKTNSPDLIFLDIQMPHLSGIQIAKELNNDPIFIFTTAHSRYAVDGFNLNALDYLLKPFDFNRFLQSVEKAKELIYLQSLSKANLQNNDFITIKVEYKNVKVYLSDIVYIEALDNYSKIHTLQKKILTLQNLRALQALLPENKFIRIHKSYIVSKDKINHYTREKIRIDDKSLPVGRAYAEQFLFRMTK